MTIIDDYIEYIFPINVFSVGFYNFLYSAEYIFEYILSVHHLYTKCMILWYPI